jgi:hypothetical protein
MNVQVFYFEGCPNYGPAVQRVKEILEEEGVAAEVWRSMFQTRRRRWPLVSRDRRAFELTELTWSPGRGRPGITE